VGADEKPARTSLGSKPLTIANKFRTFAFWFDHSYGLEFRKCFKLRHFILRDDLARKLSEGIEQTGGVETMRRRRWQQKRKNEK
jgi:hypothetical protein